MGWRAELRSLDDTEALARRVSEEVKPGSVVALVGELGAGKTTFVQALARALGVPEGEEVVSPTYALVNEYPARTGFLVHIDFYRLEAVAGALALGLDEQVERRDAVVAVEWADRLPELMPEDALWVRLSVDGEVRHAVVEGGGAT